MLAKAPTENLIDDDTFSRTVNLLKGFEEEVKSMLQSLLNADKSCQSAASSDFLGFLFASTVTIANITIANLEALIISRQDECLDLWLTFIFSGSRTIREWINAIQVACFHESASEIVVQK